MGSPSRPHAPWHHRLKSFSELHLHFAIVGGSKPHVSPHSADRFIIVNTGVALRYADFAVWQRAQQAAFNSAADLAWWVNKLQGSSRLVLFSNFKSEMAKSSVKP